MEPNTLHPDLGPLAAEVVERIGKPVDYLHVAAALEVLGLTDQVVRDRYGQPDTFSLARRLLSHCHMCPESPIIVDNRRSEDFDWKLLLISCARGSLFVLPVAVSLVVLVLSQGSFWGDFKDRPAAANSMAMALVISMIISGGFGRALVARIVESVSSGITAGLLRTAVFTAAIALLLTGISTLLVSLALGESIDRLTIFPVSLDLVLLWMGLFVLYSIHREWLFVPALISGVATAIALKMSVLLGYVGVYLLSTMVMAVVVLGTGLILLARLKSDEGSNIALEPGPWWLRLYPGQFLFGVIYFGILFADRLENWSAGDGFLFNPAYEASLDFAMFSLFIGAGVLEYRMVRFWQSIFTSRRETDKSVSSRMTRFLFNSFCVYGVTALVGMTVSLVLASMLDAGQDTVTVGLAAASYLLLVWGSFACSLYLGLRRWTVVLVAGATALTVDVGVGLLVRGVDPALTVTGLLAGSLAFFILGTLPLVRLAKNFSYYQYSSS